jgi:hypothetical protein
MQSGNSNRPTAQRWIRGLLILALVVACLGVPHLICWFHADLAVGDASDYNFTYGDCNRFETIVSASTDRVAAMREVECAGIPAAAPERDYFAFVHNRAEADSIGNLVLRFAVESDDSRWTLAPRLTWTSRNSLEIDMTDFSTDKDAPFAVQRSQIGDVSVSFSRKGGVHISDAYQRDNPGWQKLNTPFLDCIC